MSFKKPSSLDEKHVGVVAKGDASSINETDVFSNTHNDENNLVKRFSLWNTVALQVSLICSPIAVGTFLSTIIGVGGSPVLLYGFILAVSFDLIICISLAELALRWPNSAAQVHWTNILAPVKFKRILSFTTGVLSCAGWVFACFTTAYTVSMLCISLIEVYNSSFVAQNWHYYLLYLAVIFVSLLINAFAVQILPSLTYVSAAVINIGTLFIIITLLARTPKKQSSEVVWQIINNELGWSSNGVVFFLGLLPSISCVTLFEGPSHQTDEIPQPDRNVPLVMVIANSFSAIFAFLASIVYMYCITSMKNMNNPIGGEPIVQLMYDSFQSQALTTIGILFLIATFTFSLIGYFLLTSRLFWAFANSNGLPWGSRIFGKIDAYWKVPLNSLWLMTAILILLGLMMFGSSTALMAVLASSMVCINLSYIVPIGLVLYNSKFSTNPFQRLVDPSTGIGAVPYFSLGKWGMPLNIMAVVWGCFIMVWLNFPTTYPVSASSMNYACVVLGVTFFVAFVIWITYARKWYEHNGDLKHV